MSGLSLNSRFINKERVKYRLQEEAHLPCPKMSDYMLPQLLYSCLMMPEVERERVGFSILLLKPIWHTLTKFALFH